MELGGKCPAILASGEVTAKNVENILGLKMAKNGQVCISVDTVHVQQDDLPTFVKLAKQHIENSVPDYSTTTDCTGIISVYVNKLLSLKPGLDPWEQTALGPVEQDGGRS
jgi:coniferyl-aldehyde dehydrogenase